MAVHIPLVRPLGQINIDRKRLQIAKIVRDPTRKKLLGSKIQLARIPKLGLIALEPRPGSEDNLGHGNSPDTLPVERRRTAVSRGGAPVRKPVLMVTISGN